MFEQLNSRGFQVYFRCHAQAILEVDFPDAAAEIASAISDTRMPIAEIIGSGGGETKATQRMRRAFTDLGWVRTNFEISKTVNGVIQESLSHQIDHVKSFEHGTIALEIEWNNKDPFFDRDLENFKRLHAEGAISMGVVVTRGAQLQHQLREAVLRFAKEEAVNSLGDLKQLGIQPTPRQRDQILKRVERDRDPVGFGEAWADQFVADKYGAATTHWQKLMDRANRGVGNPCPLVFLGLPPSIVDFPEPVGREQAAVEIAEAAGIVAQGDEEAPDRQ